MTLTIKEIGYFCNPLVRGDIVYTKFDCWALILKSSCSDDISYVYEYSILENKTFYNSYPNHIKERDIVIAFESCEFNDIKDQYPEYFI